MYPLVLQWRTSVRGLSLLTSTVDYIFNQKPKYKAHVLAVTELPSLKEHAIDEGKGVTN